MESCLRVIFKRWTVQKILDLFSILHELFC